MDLVAQIGGRSNPLAVPLVIMLGVPLYANAAGTIPIVEALLGKGLPLGTVLAFMMAVTALSLPELLILRRVMRRELIATFVIVVSGGILAVGQRHRGVAEAGLNVPQVTGSVLSYRPGRDRHLSGPVPHNLVTRAGPIPGPLPSRCSSERHFRGDTGLPLVPPRAYRRGELHAHRRIPHRRVVPGRDRADHG